MIFLNGYRLLGFFSPHQLAFLRMFWFLYYSNDNRLKNLLKTNPYACVVENRMNILKSFFFQQCTQWHKLIWWFTRNPAWLRVHLTTQSAPHIDCLLLFISLPRSEADSSRDFYSYCHFPPPHLKIFLPVPLIFLVYLLYCAKILKTFSSFNISMNFKKILKF